MGPAADTEVVPAGDFSFHGGAHADWIGREPVRRLPGDAVQAVPGAGPGKSVRERRRAVRLLVGCRIEKDLSHLDLPPGGGDAFARPCHRLVRVSAF